jgi:hypothetical protein
MVHPHLWLQVSSQMSPAQRSLPRSPGSWRTTSLQDMLSLSITSFSAVNE